MSLVQIDTSYEDYIDESAETAEEAVSLSEEDKLAEVIPLAETPGFKGLPIEQLRLFVPELTTKRDRVAYVMTHHSWELAAKLIRHEHGNEFNSLLQDSKPEQ